MVTVFEAVAHYAWIATVGASCYGSLMISVPIDDELEREVAAVLSHHGMTTEMAVRAMFRHLAEHGSLPVSLRPPAAITGAITAGGEGHGLTSGI
ncbi:MAG: hypothetical protein EON55_15010 [Alphaproteobacteria bacterium]|nr:MAG: hypothetical protein EON55_15010 [Alphaproteobacteria bacterium]